MNKNTAISLVLVLLIVGTLIFFITKNKKAKEALITEPLVTEMDTLTELDENGNVIPAKGTTVVGVTSIYDTDWSWLFTKTSTGSQITSPDGNKFVLKFDQKTMRAYSTTDCNGLAGSLTADASKITISKITSTKKACAGETLESAYLDQLTKSASYMLKADELHIMLSDGSEMVFISVDSFSDK